MVGTDSVVVAVGLGAIFVIAVDSVGCVVRVIVVATVVVAFVVFCTILDV